MARNYRQPGENIELIAPYDRTSGQGALIGSLFGVALVNVATGSRAAFGTVGVWDLAKLSAQAWTEGARIFWDNTNRHCTTVATGNTLIGVAAAAAANPSAVGTVRLNGSVV